MDDIRDFELAEKEERKEKEKLYRNRGYYYQMQLELENAKLKNQIVEWHNASEELPRDCDNVLCYLEGGYYSVGHYISDDDEWVYQSIDLHNSPIAWCKLPQYKGESR